MVVLGPLSRLASASSHPFWPRQRWHGTQKACGRRAAVTATPGGQRRRPNIRRDGKPGPARDGLLPTQTRDASIIRLAEGQLTAAAINDFGLAVLAVCLEPVSSVFPRVFDQEHAAWAPFVTTMGVFLSWISVLRGTLHHQQNTVGTRPDMLS